ncbi:histidine kinase [Streptococcus pneumoniae]|nr:histidine kinase [Streptococcus pneumoniae]
MTLLQLQDVTYRYKNTAEAVLYQIDYNFEPGKFYSIIGESGAGKSTLLSLLAGLDSPVEGSILFQGEDIRKKGYSYHRMHHISLVFQNYNLIDYLSPLENIRLVNKKASKDTLLELGLDESQIKRNVLQENLEQESKRLNSILFYMTDGVLATNRMMRMVTDLLHLSRIDNATSHLDVELINFTAFITFILNRFDKMKGQEKEKKYELVRDYPINSIWMEIDTDKMTQVVDNILNNAIKYSPDGGKITVRMKTTEDQMILSISDHGLGIPKQDLPRIFDRFYRVDRARSRAQGGTGLGLSIAKEIIKQHKGFIWAKSEYGKGSTFTIVLPYDKDAVKEEVWEDEVED